MFKNNLLLYLLLKGIATSALLAQTNNELVTCGDNQVLIFDLDRSAGTTPYVTWRWKASEAFDLPGEYRSQLFRTLDECKPVSGGTQILITSSSGGVALLDKASKKALFYARVGNAHSAELLPGNRIVVAASTNEKGNRLELYDISAPEQPIFKDSLHSGHGAVWDEGRQLLYALGYDQLRAYSLKDWGTSQPSLRIEAQWTIPGISGHDLSPLPHDRDRLLLTEHESVWLFDKVEEEFVPFGPLEDKKDVKSVSFQPNSQRVAYIKAETRWWSHRVYLQEPSQWYSFPGIDLYKVRWMPSGTGEADVRKVIAQYVQARENRDTNQLKSILAAEVDQLVSSGTWRRGLEAAVQGMLRSSGRNPGQRTITVENVRFLNRQTAMADARYEIANPDGSVRKMWSTFILVKNQWRWQITGIRNMLPAGG